MRETRSLTHLKKLYPKAHWQTISGNPTGGVLDVNGCLNGVEIWVELKQGTSPFRSTSLIKAKVMRGQPAWEALRRQAGGRTFIALMLGSGFYVLPGWALKELADGLTVARLAELKIEPMSLFDA